MICVDAVMRQVPQRGVRESGFTLVEVMVALAIVAIALPALLTALYQQADDTAYLRDKMMAQMVAANKVEEIRLSALQKQQLKAGRETGSAVMADQEWHWWVEISTQPVPNFFRVEVRVGLDPQSKEAALYTLNAFMSGDYTTDASAAPNRATPPPSSNRNLNESNTPPGRDP